MLFHLIAVITAGVAAGGIVMMARKLSRDSLPRWLIPAAAGAAMALYTLWNDYSWAGRIIKALPEGVTVVSVGEGRSPLQPWSYLVPMRNGVLTVDERATTTGVGDNPDLRVIKLSLFKRYQPERVGMHIVDCAGARRAMVDPASRDESGLPVGGDWAGMDRSGALYGAVCGAG